jgi:hypothetical protein
MNTPVPPVASLEEIAAQADTRTVAGWEEQVLLGERGQQFVAPDTGADRRGHRLRVDHADLQLVLARLADSPQDVLLALGLNEARRRRA